MSTTSKKTKQELLEEIDALKKELADLEKYKQYQEAAGEMKAVHTSLVNSGFSGEETFQLLIAMIEKCGPFKK